MQADSTDAVYKVLSSDNLIYGPVNLDTLAQWVRERRVQRDSWVHVETANNWFAAGSLDALQPEFEAVTSFAGESQASPLVSAPATVEELRRFERFAPYSNEELALLINFSETVAAAKGDLIIKKGDMSDSLFLLLSGQARARIKVGGQDTTLGNIESGELFGEVAMLSQTARSADVVAELPTRLLKLTSDHFQELISNHPSLAAKMFYNIARLLATRLSQRTAELQKDLSSSFVWR